jgi:WD40 repeat protein
MGPTTAPSPLGNHPSAAAASPIHRVFGAVPFRTDGTPVGLAFAPDGGLWSIEEPGVLRLWDPETGRQREWTFLSELETLWAVSPDGRLLASANDEVSLWDVADGQLLQTFSQPSWVTALAFSNDGKRLATGHDDGGVRLWNPAGGELLLEIAGHPRPVSAIAFHPDGTQVASAGEEKLICLWRMSDGELVAMLAGHNDRVPALAWHPQGHRVYSAGWDATVRVWDANTFQPVMLLNSHSGQVTALALSRDGRLLACADSTRSVHVWDTSTLRTLAVLRGHGGEIRCLSFSSDSKLVASGAEDRVLYVRAWEGHPAETRNPSERPDARLPIPESQSPAVRLALSPDGTRLATTAGEKALQVWDTTKAEPILQVGEPGALHALAYSPDGRQLAGGGADGHIRLWDAGTGLRSVLLEGANHPVSALAFSADSKLLASASAAAESVWIWDLKRGEPCLLIPDAIDGCTIETVAFHPSGRLLATGGIDWLATGGSDGGVSVWDIADRCEVATFGGGVTAAVFDPTGRFLAVATLARSACVYDLEDRQLMIELLGHDDAVTCVAFSPDGRRLATGSDDRTIRFWDVATGDCVGQTELDTQIKAILFSPDGRSLFTGNGNTSCYQLDVGRLLSR